MKKKLLSLFCLALFAGTTLNAAITVRLDASTAWNSEYVYLYAWDSNYNLILGDWPGQYVTPDADGWFTYTFNSSYKSVNFYWNNGNDNRTYDLNEVTESTCYEITGYLWNSSVSIAVADCPYPQDHREITVTALSDKSAIHMKIGDADLEKVTSLKVNGSINSYDIMIIRNKMVNLKKLDLTDADIYANKYEYYTGICSKDSILTEHAFDASSIVEAKLPKSLKRIEKNTFNPEKIREIEINSGILEERAFLDYAKLQKVTIRNCDSIGSYSFTRCYSLNNVELSSPLKYIGKSAFVRCTALNSITLPSTLNDIDEFAFFGAGLTSISIPAAVSNIGRYAFAGFNGYSISGISSSNNDDQNYHELYPVEQYEGYIMANDVKYITDNLVIQPNQPYYVGYGDYYDESIGSWTSRAYIYLGRQENGKFYYWTGDYWNELDYSRDPFTYFKKFNGQLMMVANIYMYHWIHYMPYPQGDWYEYEFSDYEYECRSNGQLQSVIFEAGSALKQLSPHVFNGNESLTEFVFPDNLQVIGYKALAGTAIESITIPESVFYIDNFAFLSASSKTIELPKAIEDINPYAFYDCQSLQEMKIASTIRNVGDHAFDGCPNIKKVYTYTVEPTQIDQNTFSCWKNADLYVPKTSYYTYYYNTQWSQFLKLIEFDVPYDYFYVNNDYELGENGTIDGEPDVDLNPGSGLIITGDNQQELGEITQHITSAVSASIIACEQSLISSKLRIQISMESGVWYFLCFPFDLPTTAISWLGQFAIYEYDGAIRAANGEGGWVKFTGSKLQKGKGYIFQSAVSGDIEFTVPNPLFSCELFEQLLPVYSASAAYDANWTLIGNPFPAYFDMDQLFAAGFNSPVYVYDPNTADYNVYMPHDDEYHFSPYEAFFVQNPGDAATMLNWDAAGRETLNQAQEAAQKLARRNAQDSHRRFVELQLTNEENSKGDHTRIVFNPEAKANYELGRDAVKMSGNSPVRLYSLDDETQYSINERPCENAYVQLGFAVTETGNYVLSASRLDTAVVIYDNVEKQEVDLSLGDYRFHANAGVDNTRFSIFRIKQMITSIDELNNVFDGKVNVYSVSGILLNEQAEISSLQLPAGAYVFQSDKITRTVILK